MTYQTPVDVYRKNHFHTVDRGTLLLMLYQGAIDFVKRAKSHQEKGEMAEKGIYISKAHSIITEFRSSLNFEVGGDVARNLEGLYRFMLDQLMEAHLGNDGKPLETVMGLLATLKEGWEGAVAQVRKEGLLND
ncbi:MAG: flagellar export chaperone FliS [Candidatus Binatia bacterium]